MSVTITQGDYIYYQDTSTGAPTSRQWSFPGGTPTGASDMNPLVRYFSPSAPGYDTTLTVTKFIPGGLSLTSTKTEPNIIKVNSENLTVSLSAVPSTVPMSSQVVYGASGPTGNIDYYTWNLAGTAGFTGFNSTQNLTVDNWLTLTGSELGATYSAYVVASQVTATSLLGNTATSNVNVTYSKNGPAEIYNYIDDAYTPGVAYYSVSSVNGGSLLTSDSSMLLSGAGYVFNVDTSSASPINNQFFRAHGESVTFRSASMDLEYYSQYGFVPGQFVAAFSALVKCNTIPPSLSRYTSGNYMLPGDLSNYFSNIFNFADVLSVTKTLSDTRYWTSSEVDSIIFNDYSIASQSSRSLEIGNPNISFPVAFKEFITGGYSPPSGGGGICLPSSNGTVGNIEVHIFLNIEYSSSGTPSTINPLWTHQIDVTISNPGLFGGNGNSPDGMLVTAQDSSYGSQTGIASLINTELANNGYSGYIVAEASSAYAWIGGRSGTYYNPNEYQGLRISILDWGPTGPSGPNYITRITITDNSPWPIPQNPGNTYSAAGLTGGNSSNWLGFYNDYIVNPYQIYYNNEAPRRGWYLGSS